MKKIVFPVVATCVFLWVFPAWADVAKESFTKSGGFGGSGAFEGTTVVKLQGDKQHETTNIKFTGAVLSWAAGAGETTTITRVDKGVVWRLDTKKKTYTETPIDVLIGDGEDGKGAYADDADDEEQPTVRVTRSEFKVRKTGASQTINGFPCEEYLMTWVMELQDLETKEKTANTMETTLWTTPETPAIKKLQAEEAAFSKAYMKRLGMNFSPGEMELFGMGALAMASGAPQEEMMKGFEGLKKELAKVKGYPIRTAVSWKVKSDRQAAAPQGLDEDAVPAGAGDLFGGLQGLVSGAIAGKASGGVMPDANAPFFSSMTEVKSISTDALPASTFEVPSGYKKQK